jgi:cyclophilin family peptidyl-prolyl cis-trans isomerase
MKSFRFLPALLLLLAGVNSGPAGTIVRFQTTIGDFDVELFDADKPVTVQNFLRYVQGGYYTNMFMHRVVPNFVIQGGGYNVIGLGTANAGVEPVTTFAPIPNEFNVGKFYSNVYGTIAMAKTSDPNSATSEFFFNLADNSVSLDDTNNSGGFTVFGQVIAGTNVLNEFQLGANNLIIQSANYGGDFSEVPLLYWADPNNFSFDDLIYVDVGTPPKYAPLKATYNGLFAIPGPASQQAAGVVTVATTPTQKFTGSLRLGAVRYSFSGSFDTNGYAIVTASSKNLESLVVNINTDAALGTDKLLGSITSSNWVAGWSAYRAVFSSANPATAYAGKYTLFLPENLPGEGFAAVSVNSGGKVQIKGSLAGGTSFSQTVAVSRDGHFPLFVPLPGGSGSVSGWMSFATQPDNDVNGTLVWLQSAQPSNGSFAGAPAYETTAVGARYNPPTGGASVLTLTNCSVSFSSGGLSASFTNTVPVKAGNKLAITSPNKLTLAFTPSSGLFSGSVTPPGSPLRIPFKGALWQSRNSGYGYFINAGQGGAVLLTP